MTNSLVSSALLIFSLIVARAIAQSIDIIDICKQTPEMTAWGEYLENNPAIYNQYYADVRDKAVFIPSNEALEKFQNSTGYTIQERGNVMVDQNLFVASVFDPSPYINRQARKRDTSTGPQGKRSYTGLTLAEPISLQTEAKGINQRNIYIGMVSRQDTSKVSLKERSFQHAPDPKPPGIEISTGLGKKSQIKFGSLQAKQGILWVIDMMFEFPETVSSSLEHTGLSEFLNAVEKSEFKEKYDTADQVTIFAPIDESFNSSCSCSGLSADAVEAHVVYGAALYNSVLKDGTEFKTCQGKTLKVTVHDGVTCVNGVKLVEKDIITLNGVIHKLERPLVDSDYEDWTEHEVTVSTPVVTEYKTYSEATPTTTAVVEVKVTSSPTAGGLTYRSVSSATTVPAASAVGTSVAVPDTTTPVANSTSTPVAFTGSASMLKMVDMRITLGTFIFALAVFMF